MLPRVETLADSVFFENGRNVQHVDAGHAGFSHETVRDAVAVVIGSATTHVDREVLVSVKLGHMESIVSWYLLEPTRVLRHVVDGDDLMSAGQYVAKGRIHAEGPQNQAGLVAALAAQILSASKWKHAVPGAAASRQMLWCFTYLK